VNSVFQVSGYGAIQEFEAALERGIRFGAPIADYPTYAALVAATIAPGAWATAKAVGMARFGAPTSGLVSFLIKGDVAGPDGWARKPGQLIRRIALIAGGAGKIDDASLNALDTACPYNLSYYVDQQTTARQLIQQIAASVNAVAGVSWLGKLFVIPVKINAPTLTLAADGSALPPVGSVQQIAVSPPFKKLAIGAERTWAVHALSDIAFTAELLPLGAYNALTIYREGNITDAADGSRFLYISTAPGAGHAPPAATFPPTAPATNAYWKQIAPPTTPIAPNGTTLLTLINDAQADANEALDGLAEAGDDGKLTGPEKIQKVIPGNAELEAAWSLLDTQAAAVSGFTAVSSARATAAAARTAWIVYRDGLSPAWDNTGLTTAITRATYNGKLGDYRYAIQLLDDALRQYAQTRSTWSGTSNDNGQRPSDGATNDLNIQAVGVVSIVGNAITRTSGADDYAAMAMATAPIFGAQTAGINIITTGTAWTMVALDNDQSTSATAYSDMICVAHYNYSTGGLNIYMGGSSVFSTTIGAYVGRLEVSWDGRFFTVRVAGGWFWSSKVQTGIGALYAKFWAFSGSTTTYTGLSYWADTPPTSGTATFYDARNEAIGGSAWELRGTSAFYRTAAGWVGNAYSLESFTGTAAISARFVSTSDTVMVGLTDNRTFAGTADYQYGSFLIYNAGGVIYAYESGTGYNLGTTFSSACTVAVTYDGLNVRYYVNGVLKRTTPTTAGRTLYACLASAASGSTVADIQFGAFSQNDWASMGGTGLPSDGATSDLRLTPVVSSTYVTIVGNSILGLSNGSYSTCVVTTPVYGATFVEKDIRTSAYNMVALDDSAAGSDYTVQSAVLHFYEPTGHWDLYFNGSNVTNGTAGAGITGKVTLVCDRVNLYVVIGGVVRGTIAAPAALTGSAAIYPKWWAYNDFTPYTGLRCGPWTSNSWGDVGGTGKPEDGADVTLTAQTTVVIATTINIPADYTGTIASGTLPKSVAPVVTRGGTVVTEAAATGYSVGNFAGGCSSSNVSVNNTTGTGKGIITVGTGFNATGSFDLTVTYNSIVVSVTRMTVSKNVADAPSGSGSGSSGFTKNGNFNANGVGVGSTSFSQIGLVINMVKAAGETIRGTFNATYYSSGTGNVVNRTMSAKWQYSVAGANSWTDFASAVTGSAAQTSNLTSQSDPGSITCNQSATPANGNYDIRLVAAISSSVNSAVVSLDDSPGSVAIAV
jgi:hypothetical protein